VFKELFRREEGPLVHPDFRVRDGFWTWNYNNFGTYIQEKKPHLKTYDKFGIIKVAFPFDDPSLLDNCPFMCKIGKNDTSDPGTQWFGVAYGYEDDAAALEAWAARFPSYELITSTDDTGETRARV
jgi:hypothetical protein